MGDSEDIAQLKNLRLPSAERLHSVGMATREKLREIGAAAADSTVKQTFPLDTSLVLLWATQGALMEIHWQKVPNEIKQHLREQIAS